eukprot:GHVL01023768.1.p1 GENE.GHVL01023768.1~~GHVL01023768.1.p1  ORF type:complete len:310 (+),score=71.38 GHVL01023768.1:51-980(+)
MEVSKVDGCIEKLAALNLSSEEKEVVEQLREVHDKHTELEAQYMQEFLELRRKFELKSVPLHEERNKILTASTDSDSKGTPALNKFWLQVMKNNHLLNELIESQDERPLSYLQDITKETILTDGMGFKLYFKFGPNPYFEEEELEKRYYLLEESDPTEPILSRTEGTNITWKENQDTTKKTVSKRQKNKKTKMIRFVESVVEVPSFFRFFMGLELPSPEKLSDLTDEQIETLEIVVEADFEAGCIFRDKVIPHAIKWYTGEEEDSSVEDDDEEHMSSEEEDSEAESEDSEDVCQKSKKKGKKKRELIIR